jgi:glycosyltransferase involved in cell wall biosynthesis
MKVLVVGPLPPPNGGMALQTEALVRQLRAEQLQVEIVAVNAPYQPAWIGRIPVLRAGFRLLPYLWRLWQATRRAELVHILANSGWSWFLFSVPAIRIAHWQGKPVVLNYRGGLAREFFARSFAKVRRRLQQCDALIVPTTFLQQVFAEYDQRAEIVPNIVDTQLFAPTTQPPAQLHVVVTRNLEALYDNASALRALALIRHNVPDARLTLTGEGPERAPLQALAAELGISDAVHFAGRLPREQVASLLHSARVLLNPSTADNSPNSLIEAMAAGVPIVSTDVGGVPQLCQPGVHALLVPARAPEQMAAAILQLHQNDVLRQQLITHGRDRAAEFSWPKVWPALQENYARACAQRRMRHA